jgi:hypothetical protein
LAFANLRSFRERNKSGASGDPGCGVTDPFDEFEVEVESETNETRPISNILVIA